MSERNLHEECKLAMIKQTSGLHRLTRNYVKGRMPTSKFISEVNEKILSIEISLNGLIVAKESEVSEK